jgi:hypothetical protein
LLLLWTQGDRIGRIFAQRAIVFFGHFWKSTKEAYNFWQLFSMMKAVYYFFTKIGFWVIWSQTHLVTLFVLQN